MPIELISGKNSIIITDSQEHSLTDPHNTITIKAILNYPTARIQFIEPNGVGPGINKIHPVVTLSPLQKSAELVCYGVIARARII